MLNWLGADLATDFQRLHAAVLRIQCLEKPELTRLPISEETFMDGNTSVLRHNREVRDEQSTSLDCLRTITGVVQKSMVVGN